MMEMLPENYYAGMWFVSLPDEVSKFGKGADVNAIVFQRPGDTKEWRMTMRIRSYRGPEIFDHDDDKEWFNRSGNFESEGEAMDSMESLFKEIFHKSGLLCVVDFFPMHCKGEEAVHKMLNSPPKWLHCKRVPVTQ